MCHRSGLAWLAGGLLLASIITPMTATAGAPPEFLSADTALQIVQGCVAHAKAKGQSQAIAVYDEGGHPVALLRMDGNAPGVTEFAMQKAEAVAYWRFSTAEMVDAVRDTPGFAHAPHVVLVPGGVPVFTKQGRFVGTVGVSGEAPADDAACAEAGVRAAGFSTIRKK
jgi:glc operon protein GlcG